MRRENRNRIRAENQKAEKIEAAPPGRLFALYVGGYALGRLWVEALRIDPASRIAGVRVNIWVSIVTLAITVAWLVATRHRSGPANPGPSSTPTGETVPRSS